MTGLGAFQNVGIWPHADRPPQSATLPNQPLRCVSSDQADQGSFAVCRKTPPASLPITHRSSAGTSPRRSARNRTCSPTRKWSSEISTLKPSLERSRTVTAKEIPLESISVAGKRTSIRFPRLTVSERCRILSPASDHSTIGQEDRHTTKPRINRSYQASGKVSCSLVTMNSEDHCSVRPLMMLFISLARTDEYSVPVTLQKRRSSISTSTRSAFILAVSQLVVNDR